MPNLDRCPNGHRGISLVPRTWWYCKKCQYLFNPTRSFDLGMGVEILDGPNARQIIEHLLARLGR